MYRQGKDIVLDILFLLDSNAQQRKLVEGCACHQTRSYKRNVQDIMCSPVRE
jgi:hypothetical protein